MWVDLLYNDCTIDRIINAWTAAIDCAYKGKRESLISVKAEGSAPAAAGGSPNSNAQVNCSFERFWAQG